MSSSYGKSSSSYYYSSSSSASDGENISGHRYTASSETNPDGSTHVRTAQQDLGDPPIIEEHYYDGSGQERLPESGSSPGGVRRITELDDEYDNMFDSGMGSREDV